MEPNSASRELCRGQIRSYLISSGCTFVRFCKDKDTPRGNQNYLSSMARVHKSFRTCCWYYGSTCMVHYRPPMNYCWSKKFVRRKFPIWTLKNNIQWSCTNSSIWIWMSWHQCWRLRNTFYKKGSSYVFSHMLYSISTYDINYPPGKLYIRGLKDRYIKYKKNRYQFVGRAVTVLPILKKRICNVPSFTFYFIISK